MFRQPRLHDERWTVADAESEVLRSVLACTDFSEASNAAVRAAVAICTRSGAQLCVLHVDAQATAAGALTKACGRSERRKMKLEEKLAAAVHIAREMGANATGVLVTGDSKSTILQSIAQREIDLAVVGTRGARGLRRLLFGSTAEVVFRSAQCPVITVGPGAVSVAKSAKDGPIVFATDFHEPAVEAAHWAARLANLYNAELHCIHVLPLSVEAEVENTMVVSVMTTALRELTHDGSECERRPVFEVIFGGKVCEAVVDYSRRHHARAIVLGARRKIPFAAHLPPQIEYKIIAAASCPVVTVSYDAPADEVELEDGTLTKSGRHLHI